MDQNDDEYEAVMAIVHDLLATVIDRKRGDTVYKLTSRQLDVFGAPHKIEYVSEAECRKRYPSAFKTETREVVINGCHGGFNLSDEAFDTFLKLEGIVDNDGVFARDIPRDNPNLVRVVKELGAKANGRYSKLYIVEIPRDVDWIVCEYDGAEHVAERHRTWG